MESAGRKEPEGEPKTGLGEATPGKRRRRKDLFSGSEAFSRVDAHAIRAGAEVSGGGLHPGTATVSGCTTLQRTP